MLLLLCFRDFVTTYQRTLIFTSLSQGEPETGLGEQNRCPKSVSKGVKTVWILIDSIFFKLGSGSNFCTSLTLLWAESNCVSFPFRGNHYLDFLGATWLTKLPTSCNHFDCNHSGSTTVLWICYGSCWFPSIKLDFQISTNSTFHQKSLAQP